MLDKIKEKLTVYQIIIIAYLVIIFAGAGLLSLPFASKEGVGFLDCVFTSTSALCVTGLVIGDTYLTWTLFGKIVILFLIQIGGLGFMTLMTMFALAIKGKLSLSEQTMLSVSSNVTSAGNSRRIIRYIALTTLIVELIGAGLLSIRFCQDMPVADGLFTSLFVSISAFCNAGFDILGRFGPYSSLTHYSGDFLVNIVIMLLIIIGGLGFLVYSDMVGSKFHWKKLSLHTKIVLIASFTLIFAGAGLYLLCEWNYSLNGKNVWEKILASLFQSVTTRTAGFNTVDLASTSEGGRYLMIMLMLIGGSPGSTAGGIKTTTFVVMLFTIIANIKRKERVTIGKRSLEQSVMSQATAIFCLYIVAASIGTMAVLLFQPELSLSQALFEVVSAVGTVGLSTGITSLLTIGSKIVIILLMLGGRLGLLSLVMVFAGKSPSVPIERPVERILVG